MDVAKEIDQCLKEKFYHAIGKDEKRVEKDEKRHEKDEKRDEKRHEKDEKRDEKDEKKDNLSKSIHYLKEKCCNGLEERERDPSKVPLHNQFVYIKGLLDSIFKDPSRYEEKKIRGILYSLDDVWTECQITSNASIITLDRLNRKLNEIKAELEMKPGDGKGLSSPQPPDAHRPRSPSVDASQGEPSKELAPQGEPSKELASPGEPSKELPVHGFHDEVISQQKVLLKGSDDGFKAIAIVGMAGIGKTTLCQSLLSKSEVKEHFHPRILVRMPRQRGNDEDKKEATLRRTLASLGVEKKIVDEVYKEHKLKGLLYAVSRQLQEKRYLIVLDDARDPHKPDRQNWYGDLKSGSPRDKIWDRLACGLPKGCGGAVIVTSRKEKLAKDMVGEKGIHQVLPLVDPEHCWLIYREAAETDFEKLGPSINERILKEELQRRCAGHPLTAKSMGEMTKRANA